MGGLCGEGHNCQSMCNGLLLTVVFKYISSFQTERQSYAVHNLIVIFFHTVDHDCKCQLVNNYISASLLALFYSSIFFDFQPQNKKIGFFHLKFKNMPGTARSNFGPPTHETVPTPLLYTSLQPHP